MRKIIYIAFILFLSASCEKNSDVPSNIAGTTWEYSKIENGVTYRKELKFRNNKEGSFYESWITSKGVGSSSSDFFVYDLSGTSIYKVRNACRIDVR